MELGKGNNEAIIFVRNGAGDVLSFHKHNTRRAHCVECGTELQPGRGIRRQVRFAAGSGYLCHTCAGAAIRSQAQYMLHRWSATLMPFDGIVSCYAIPSAELAQAWHDHGSYGLRLAAETLREQARAQFLGPIYTPETIHVQPMQAAL